MKKTTFSKFFLLMVFMFKSLFQVIKLILNTTVRELKCLNSIFIPKNTFSRLQNTTTVFLLSLFLLSNSIAFSQIGKAFTPRLTGGSMSVKGDVVLIGNSIVNRASTLPIFNPVAGPQNNQLFTGTVTNLNTITNQANVAFDSRNDTDNNNNFFIEYSNVDPGTAAEGIFSSSSADLVINQTCKKIKFAGLYWSAIYPTERSTNTGEKYNGSIRSEEYNKIKFKLPGATSYQDITADDIIFTSKIIPAVPATGINDATFFESPYVCFKDVTSLLASLKNGSGADEANGKYTVANVRATRGKKSGGGAGGWTLVVIYETPTLPSKFISVFDGYASVNGTTTVDIAINGYQTLPTLKVNAKIGVAALEGDVGLKGDTFQFRNDIPATGIFTALYDGANPVNNFFNATISDNGVISTNRNPASQNSMGFDIDNIVLDNNNNTVIPNNAKAGTLKLTTNGDGYGAFLTTFAVEIIEPKIVLTKKVINTAGNNITNQIVNRGDELRYVIGFENIGSDKAKNVYIEDYLPNIVFFNYPADLLPLPTGVTVDSYNPSVIDPHDGVLKRRIVFKIDDLLVDLKNDQERFISFKVHVPVDCKDFSDACSNEVKNIAYSKYTGVQNNGVFGSGSQPPNVDCALGDIATNFIGNIDDCLFDSKYTLCTNTVDISGRNGFKDYTWTGPNGFTGTGQTISVTKPGDYIVKANPIAPCLKTLTQTVKVELYSNSETDALLKYAANLTPNGPISDRGEIVQCSIDGKKMPHIFLCGAGDQRDMSIVNAAATAVEWYQLTGAACIADAALNNGFCANEDSNCTWTLLKTSPNYTANTAGYFKAIVRYGACFNTLYFNVYKNELNPTATTTNIICAKAGTMTVAGVPANGYEYSFNLSTYTGAKTFTSGPSANVFSTLIPENYTATIRQIGVPDGCEFTVSGQIDVVNFEVKADVTQPTCNDVNGAIKVTATGGATNYVYTLSKGGSLIQTVGPVSLSNNTFLNQSPGTYSVNVKTDEGCNVTVNNIVINTLLPLTASVGLTKALTCSDGEITITAAGGTPLVGPPPYYLYRVNGAPSVSDPVIPITLPLPPGGVFDIQVTDENNCNANTTITVQQTPKPVYTIKTANLLCYGSNTGSITFDVTANAGAYILQYSIDGGTKYFNDPVFSNLDGGTIYSPKIKYSLGGVDCEEASQDIILTGATSPLSASAGVAELAGCGAGGTGKLRITNSQGGTPGYTYSFDGGATWQNTNEKDVLPGTYTLVIRDSKLCTFSMPSVVLDPIPTPPTITVDTSAFNCNGTATSTVSVTNAGSANFEYEYLLDGTPNPNTADPKVFLNVLSGPHTITVNYKLVSVPTYSNLLKEDFASGLPTTTSGIAAAYCFNDQRVNAPYLCATRSIEDNQYSVTNDHWRGDDPTGNNSGAWYHFKDHTSNGADPKGRFLLVNIGSAAGPYGVLYSKPIVDVIPNQDVIVDVYLANLLRIGINGADPDFIIELVDSFGTVVASDNTGIINKNEIWNKRTVNLNPGTNSSLTFVIRSGSILYGGNDALIDDITVYQLPKSCITEKVFNIIVPTDKAFAAQITGSSDLTCASADDGTITIAAQNFDTAIGFQYSIDGGTTWATSMTSPVKIVNLKVGNYDIRVRYNAGGDCTLPLGPIEIKAPDAILVTTAIQTPPTCTTGATIRATATGGSSGYEYELREADGITPVRVFQSSRDFTNIPTGTYTVVVRDVNKCTSPASATIEVEAPTPPTAAITPNAGLCFDGSAANISVTITGGLSPYSYKVKIGAGAYSALSPTFAGTSFTYPVTATGDYSFIVVDKNNCEAPAVTQTISPKLTAVSGIKTALSCAVPPASNATIEVTITGGTAPYTYIVKQGATTLFTSASIAGPKFTYDTAAAGTFTFEIKDKNNCPIAIDQIVNPLVAVTAKATVTDVTCFNAANGSVILEALTGVAPYTFQITSGIATLVSSNNTTASYKDLAGSVTGIPYNYTVTDAKGCVKTDSFVVKQPASLTATASMSAAYTCDNPATITTSASGGNGITYTYALMRAGVATAVASNTTGIFTNLTVAGDYTVVVTDGKGCAITTNPALTIVALNPPLNVTFVERVISCKLNEDKSQVTVSVTAGTGTPALKYEITAPAVATTNVTGATTGVFTGLTAGPTGTTYSFKVTDANNCSATAVYNVKDVLPVVVNGSLVSNVSCKGSSDGKVTFTVSGNSGIFTYELKNSSNAIVPIAQSTQTGNFIDYTGLLADTYTITITNPSTNCTATKSIVVSEPTVALAILLPTITPITCLLNGKVVINTTGGWGNNKYTLTQPDNSLVGSQSSSTFNNLTQDGTYGISVTDLNGNGCTVTSTFVIDAKITPSASIDATSDLCYDAVGKAKIVVTPTVPSPNYVYNINNGAYTSSGTFANLNPGSYIVKVKDTSTGCILTLAAQTIAPELKFNAVLDKAANCLGQDTDIKGTISGGTVPYTYTVTINGTLDATVRTVAGTTFIYTDATATTAIANTTYLFTLSDSSLPTPGCSITSTVVVAPKTDPEFTATPNSTILCNGESTGSITVTIDPNKGASPYVIDIVNTTTSTSYGTKTTGLPAGFYTVTVTDAKGCFLEKTNIEIKEPTKITFTEAVQQITCDQTGGSGTSFGSISVTGLSGGKPNYIYTLTSNTSATQTFSPVTNEDHIFTVLNFGIYELTVTDANGCSVKKTISLSSPPTDLIINVTAGAPSCTSASLIVSVDPTFTGGPYHFALYPINSVFTPPYSYPLNPVGTYQDADSPTHTAVPDLYLQSTFTGLNPGVTYSFIVYDEATKCYFFKQAEAPTQTLSTLTSTITPANVTCQGTGDGKVSFTLAGFNAAATDVKYEVFNSQTNLPYSPAISGMVTKAVATAGFDIPASLIPGTYYILFTEFDNVGAVDLCINSSKTITITQSVTPLLLNASSTKNDNCGIDKGIIEAFGQGGTTIAADAAATPPITAVPYLYQVFPDDGAIGVIDGTDPVVSTAFAATFSVASHTSNTFNKESGHYIVYVRDAYGCIQYKFVEVLLDPEPVITAVLNDACATEGSFVIDVVNTTVLGIAPYTYSLDGGAFEPQAALSFSYPNISSGDHTVEVKDFNGCTFKITLPKIAEPLDINASFTTDPKCKDADGVITAVVTGGSVAPPLPANHFEYTLVNNTIPLTPDVVQNDNAVFTAQAAGNYTVIVKDLVTNCSQSTIVDLLVPTDVVLVPADIVATPVDCNAPQGTNNNGTITVNLDPLNDNPDYTYTLTPVAPLAVVPVTQTTNYFTGLLAGDYTVTVTSGRGCEETVLANVQAPIVVSGTATATPFSCAVDPTTTTVVVEGFDGTGTYTFSNNGTDYFTSNSVTPDNKYTFDLVDNGFVQNPTYYVKDTNGCVQAISLPSPVDSLPKFVSAVAAKVGTAMDCTVANNHQDIKVDIVGGSNAPNGFTYQVYQDGVLIPGLVAVPVNTSTFTYAATTPGSSYEFEIFDNNTTCSIITNAVEVPVFNIAKVIATAAANVDCNGNNSGAIEINIVDYIGLYDYEVFDGITSITTGSANTSVNPFVIPFGLVAGTNYTVVVKESGYPKCDITSNVVVITEPTALDLSALVVGNVNQNCNSAGAVLTVDVATIAGGTKDYMYAFVTTGATPTATDYSTSNTKTIATSKIAPLFDTYDVYVKDVNGCEAFVTNNISLDPLPAITAVNVVTHCPSAAGYRIDVTATGVGPLKYSLDGVQFQDEAFFIVNNAGDYTVTVMDKNQCLALATSSITIFDPLTLRGEVSLLPKCLDLDGEITLYAEGGTVTPANNYEYTKDNWLTSQPSNVFTLLAPGTYNFIVRDLGTGCEKGTQVIIDIPTGVSGISPTATPVSCYGGSDGTVSVSIAASNNNPVYTYALSGNDILNNPVSRSAQDSPLFENLAASDAVGYTVKVTSGRGCEDTATIVVTEPALIVVNTVDIAQFTCTAGTNGANNATITVVPGGVTGGSRNYIIYEFSKNGVVVQRTASNIYIESDYAGANYSVKVYDDNTCSGSYAAAIKIDAYTKIDKINIVVNTPITCKDPEEITATAVNAAGIALTGIEYTIADENGVQIGLPNNNGIFTGLVVGQYTITALNTATTCSIQTIHYVNEPNTFDLKVVKTSDVICFGSDEGSIDVTLIDNQTNPINDAGPFTYEVKDVLGNIVKNGNSGAGVTATVSGLIAGGYTITTTLVSTPYCSTSSYFTIDQPSAALTISETHSEITCVPGNDGTIVASATGGWAGGYQYQLELGGTPLVTWSTVSNFTNLSAGNYIVKVRDSKSCERQIAVNLSLPTVINATIIVDTAVVKCFGDNSATITVQQPVTGGSGVFNYTLETTYLDGRVTLNGPQSSNVFTNLGVASYRVLVSDTWKCSAPTNTLVIGEPAVVTASLVGVSKQTCVIPATVTLTATGGTGPYVYSSDANFATVSAPFANTVTFSVPFTTVAVDYQYYVRDINGCKSFASNSVSIVPLEKLDFKFIDNNPYISCFGDNSGEITAVASGGAGNYVYTLLDGAGNPILPTPLQPTPGYFKGLLAGNYLMNVTSGDCIVANKPITISQPNEQFILNTPVVTNVTCNGDGNGSVSFTTSGGTGIIKFALSPYLDKFVTDGTFLNLAPGPYQAVIQDTRGCKFDFNFVISEPLALDAKVDTLKPIEQAYCVGDTTGAFSIIVTAGSGTAPYSTSLDDPNGTFVQDQFDFSGLTGGDHIVYIRDANLCIFELTVALDKSVLLDPKAVLSYDCVDNLPANKVTVTIDASNNPADVKYSLDNTGIEQDSNVFTNLTPGGHFIMVHHKNSCVDATPGFIIKTVDPLALSLDLGGLNEIVATATGGSGVYQYSFNVESTESNNKYIYYRSGNYTVIVTDTNGCSISVTKYFDHIDIKIPPIFTPNDDGNFDLWKPTNTDNYPDIRFVVYDRYGREVGQFGAGEGWDGKYNGKELPMGDYWYILKLRNTKDQREFIGHFTLYR